MLEISRNQWFVGGLLILLVGVQLRMVETFTISKEATKVLAKVRPVSDVEQQTTQLYLDSAGEGARKTFTPPNWVGWMMMSVGGVLVMHAMAMKKE